MDQPHLEKPGAGLPFLEALMVRWYVGPFQSRKNDAQKNLRLFSMAGARILKEAASVPEDKRDQKVLVPRMKGVEDSSRFWCANEVLEHRMITGEDMRSVIESLADGETTDCVGGGRLGGPRHGERDPPLQILPQRLILTPNKAPPPSPRQ